MDTSLPKSGVFVTWLLVIIDKILYFSAFYDIIVQGFRLKALFVDVLLNECLGLVDTTLYINMYIV